MRVKCLIPLIAVSSIIFAASSCQPEDIQTKYASQESNIENFVAAQLKEKPEMRVEYNNGVVRLVLTEGEGEQLQSSGTLTIKYAAYNFSSGSITNDGLIATNSSEVVAAAGWELTGRSYENITLTLDNSLVEGLREGLIGVKRGEECLILFSGRHAHGRISVGTIPAYAPMAYHIWIQDIENNQ